MFTSLVTIAGSARITVDTEVTFEDEGAGTLMTLRQQGVIHDENFPGTEGAAEDWRTTLDKLEQEVAPLRTRRRRRAGLPAARPKRYCSAKWMFAREAARS